MNDQYASWRRRRTTRSPAASTVICLTAGPEIHRQGRQRLPALQGVHVHGLPRADPDQRAERAHAPGQLRAVPRGLRARHRARKHDRARTPYSACIAIAAPATERGRDGSLASPNRDRGDVRLRCWSASSSVCAVLVFLVAGLLTTIFERKQEARNPYVRLVEVSEETTDPAPWGVNWPREYDDYRRTAEVDQYAVRRVGVAARGKGRCATRGSPACSRATRSRSTTGIGAGTPTCCRIRSRRGASRSGRSPARASSVTPR